MFVDVISHVWLSAAPWAIGQQSPLSMEFPRQEYWSGLPFLTPGDLPDPGIEPRSLALQADSYTIWATWEAQYGLKTTIWSGNAGMNMKGIGWSAQWKAKRVNMMTEVKARTSKIAAQDPRASHMLTPSKCGPCRNNCLGIVSQNTRARSAIPPFTLEELLTDTQTQEAESSKVVSALNKFSALPF